MKIVYRLSAFLLVTLLLSSCQFHCSVGDVDGKQKEKSEKNKPVVIKGAALYNGIQLTANQLKVYKAYLVFKDNNERVPEDNFVDFKSPVKLILLIDDGWTTLEGKVWPGASEKIVAENGEVLLDEEDLFGALTAPGGISPEDAEIIQLTAAITLPPKSPPTSFTIFFKIWDKQLKGYTEGSYKLYSK